MEAGKLATRVGMVAAVGGAAGWLAPVLAQEQLATELVVAGLDAPVGVVSPPADERLFVIERTGRTRIVADDALLPVPFLDLSADVGTGFEQGLLGLAFHPEHAQTGYSSPNQPPLTASLGNLYTAPCPGSGRAPGPRMLSPCSRSST